MPISACPEAATERIRTIAASRADGMTTGPLTPGTTVRYRRTMTGGQTATLYALLVFIVASGGGLLWLLATHAHVTSSPAAAVLAIMLALETIRVVMGVPVAVLATRACDPVPMIPARADGDLPRVAMLTTFVPGEAPLHMVRPTLAAMRSPSGRGVKHVYLLDEGGAPEVRAMCAGSAWPLHPQGRRPVEHRLGCVQGQDQGGQPQRLARQARDGYDVVAQLDLDHVPDP